MLSGNGIKVIFSDKAVPTPLVSLAIKNKKLAGGIVVTASHNPPAYNGIKIKASYGGSADENITRSVEALLGKNEIKSISVDEGIKAGIIELVDLRPDYQYEFGQRT